MKKKQKPTVREALAVIGACTPAQHWVQGIYSGYKPKRSGVYWERCDRTDWMAWLVARTYDMAEWEDLGWKIVQTHSAIRKVVGYCLPFQQSIDCAMRSGFDSRQTSALIAELYTSAVPGAEDAARIVELTRVFVTRPPGYSRFSALHQVLMSTSQWQRDRCDYMRRLAPWPAVEKALYRQMKAKQRCKARAHD